MLRLFFALQPDAAAGAALAERMKPIAEELAAAQCVPAENLHATLCFVGAVAPERLPSLCEAAARVRGSPITLRFEALEYWDRPEVLCATASDDADVRRARQLSRDLSSQAIAAGFAPDVKEFRAHLTLARKVSPERAASAQWPRALAPEFAMRCDRFVLMESRRGELGSIYSVVDSWPLMSTNES